MGATKVLLALTTIAPLVTKFKKQTTTVAQR